MPCCSVLLWIGVASIGAAVLAAALSLALRQYVEVSMRKSSTLTPFVRKYSAALLVPLIAITFLLMASCGGDSMMMTSTRQMQSIMVTPMTANGMASNGM